MALEVENSVLKDKLTSMDAMIKELAKMVKEEQSARLLDPYNIGANDKTIHHFMADIAIAKRDGREDINTTDKIIRHFNPNGLGGTPYFMYDGIRVWKEEDRGEYLEKHSMGTDAMNHPADRESAEFNKEQIVNLSTASINKFAGIKQEMQDDGLI